VLNKARRAGPPNISPVRQGWETDTQHCGAPEARHYILILAAGPPQSVTGHLFDRIYQFGCMPVASVRLESGFEIVDGANIDRRVAQVSLLRPGVLQEGLGLIPAG
jgi:hypothetical protein